MRSLLQSLIAMTPISASKSWPSGRPADRFTDLPTCLTVPRRTGERGGGGLFPARRHQRTRGWGRRPGQFPGVRRNLEALPILTSRFSFFSEPASFAESRFRKALSSGNNPRSPEHWIGLDCLHATWGLVAHGYCTAAVGCTVPQPYRSNLFCPPPLMPACFV